MAKKRLKSDLSVSGIEKLQEQIREYQTSLESKVDIYARRLAQEGVLFAKYNVKDFDAVFVGDLLSSIKLRTGSKSKGKSVYFVVADSDHAAFVEFGTGYEGEEHPYSHPLPEGATWKYVTGYQIVNNAKKHIYGWFYERDGNVYFTEGMPSRPFMWNTSQQLNMKAIQIAREVFGGN